MIFPHNIEGYIQSTKSSSMKDKMGVFCIILIGFTLYMVYTVGPFLQINYRIPRWLTFLVFLILDISIIVTVFRIFVVKEDAQLKEFDNSRSDSLANYYYIREKENAQLVDDIEVFEHLDGNIFVCLQLLQGPSDERKAEGTYRLFCKLLNTITMYCVDFRIYVQREDFADSVECKRFMKPRIHPDNKELSSATMEIRDMVLDFTINNSQLLSTYFVIRFAPVDVDNIKIISKEVERLVNEGVHSIRGYRFLNKSAYRNFVKDYHRVQALDLSNIRNPQASLKIMRMYGKDIYAYDKKDFSYSFRTGVKKL